MNIKKASEKSGVSADTIRYYERIGLIHPVERNKNGIRNFDEEDLKWIHFAKSMRAAGLSIEKLSEYVRLFHEGDKTIPARKKILSEQIEELKEKLSCMSDTLSHLEFKLEHYDDHINPFEKNLKK